MITAPIILREKKKQWLATPKVLMVSKFGPLEAEVLGALSHAHIMQGENLHYQIFHQYNATQEYI